METRKTKSNAWTVWQWKERVCVGLSGGDIELWEREDDAESKKENFKLF